MTELRLNVSDWVAVLAYFVVTFLIAWRARVQQTNAAEYFLDGRRTHWFIVSVSLWSTLFSTVSFVAMPGEAYRNGMLFSLYSLGYFLFTPLALWLFLRFFYDTKSFTAYEYLERRFDARVRASGAVLFLGARLLSGATVFYAAATVFEKLVGWPAEKTILIVGTFTICYCYFGGMRAIMLTDFLQALIILLGIACILVKLLVLVGFDVLEVWRYAAEHGKTFAAVTDKDFFSFDPHVRFSFWVWLTMSLLGPLDNYGTDQLVVQRILSTSSYANARRAILVKTAMTLPISVTFYFVGLLLYYFYHHVTGNPPQVDADQVLGVFINQHLPTPVPGLIVAALLAALMSATSSTVGSISTVTTIDLVQRFSRTPMTHTQVLHLGKWCTVIGGVVTLGLALVLISAGKGTKTSVLEVNKVAGSLWGVLLIVVLAGIFTKWVTARAAFVGLLVGLVMNATLPWVFYYGVDPAKRISFAWVGLPGMIVAALIVFILSRFDSRKQTKLAGLTWSTLPAKKPSSEFPA